MFPWVNRLEVDRWISGEFSADRESIGRRCKSYSGNYSECLEHYLTIDIRPSFYSIESLAWWGYVRQLTKLRISGSIQIWDSFKRSFEARAAASASCETSRKQLKTARKYLNDKHRTPLLAPPPRVWSLISRIAWCVRDGGRCPEMRRFWRLSGCYSGVLNRASFIY